MAKMTRQKIEINPSMSYNELERFLISSEVSLEKKKKIKGWLKTKQQEIDKEIKGYQNGKRGILDYYSDMNPLWRLAKYQLYREGNLNFKMKGKAPYVRIACNEEENKILILDMMDKIKTAFRKRSRPNYNQSIEDNVDSFEKDESYEPSDKQ